MVNKNQSFLMRAPPSTFLPTVAALLPTLGSAGTVGTGEPALL